MATIQELMLRAQLLKQETALDSISPERAGGIMYDTLAYINQMQLQGANPLLISKIYASVAAMEADTAPVSDLTGQALRPGQVVVIASADSDNGSVYRYNGGTESRWTVVGKIGNLTPVDSLDSDSTQLPLAARQGKVLDEKVSDLDSYIFGADGVSWEIGNITINKNGWYYSDSTTRVRTTNGTTVPCRAGQVVGFKSWSGKRMYIGYRRSNGTYGTPGSWQTADYVLPEDGVYVFLLSNQPESTITDAEDLYGDFFISSLDDKVKELDKNSLRLQVNAIPRALLTSSTPNKISIGNSGSIRMLFRSNADNPTSSDRYYQILRNAGASASNGIFIAVSRDGLYGRVGGTYVVSDLKIASGKSYDLKLDWDSGVVSLEVNGQKLADSQSYSNAIDSAIQISAGGDTFPVLPMDIYYASIDGKYFKYDESFEYVPSDEIVFKNAQQIGEIGSEVFPEIFWEQTVDAATVSVYKNADKGYLYLFEVLGITGTLNNNGYVGVSGMASRNPVLRYINNAQVGAKILFPVYDCGYTPVIDVMAYFTSDEHVYSFRISKIRKLSPLDNFLNYEKALKNTLNFEWLQGYWNTPFSRASNVNYWCCTNIQFNRGRRVRFTFSSDYYVIIRGFFYPSLDAVNTIGPVASGTIYETANWMIWSVQIRKISYEALTPEDAANAITIEQIDGDVYSKKVTINDFSEFLPTYDTLIEQINGLKSAVQVNERFGVSEIGALYHHLNVEVNNFVIPSQSLVDIAYAKSLGFKVIEGNVQTCSDGVAVIKHGISGKLGAGLSFASGSGLSADTLFSEVTSTSLRQNVTYNSTFAKYNGHIPTLEEFCAECARLGMIPYLRGVNAAGLAIARQYLPDERMIVEGISSRGDFRGLMTNYGSLESADQILATAKNYGAPYFYGFGHMTSLSDSVVAGVFKTMHENGFMLAGAYINATEYQKYKGMGLDLLASITNDDIPAFDNGNELNIIGCKDAAWVLDSATYNATRGTIEMDAAGTIKVNSEAIGHNLSKLCLRVMFNGQIDIVCGSSQSSAKIVDLVSNGEQEYIIAHAVQNINQNEVFRITAKAATEIIDISLYGSVVIGL